MCFEHCGALFSLFFGPSCFPPPPSITTPTIQRRPTSIPPCPLPRLFQDKLTRRSAPFTRDKTCIYIYIYILNVYKIDNQLTSPASQPARPAVLTFSTFSLQRARIPKNYWYYGTPEGYMWWGSQGREHSIVSLYIPTHHPPPLPGPSLWPGSPR